MQEKPVLLKGEVEGRVRSIRHEKKERSTKIVLEAKQHYFEKDPNQPCEVCGFSHYETYGVSYIEAHHKVPLHRGVRRTTTQDFAMLCANCHRMVHSTKWRDASYQVFKQEVQSLLKEKTVE